jgi:hypothetical protein
LDSAFTAFLQLEYLGYLIPEITDLLPFLFLAPESFSESRYIRYLWPRAFECQQSGILQHHAH